MTLLAWLLLLASPAIVHAGPFTEIVVFGDSLSDTGNVDRATLGLEPGSAYFDGRFSNGILWVEYLADDLGLTRPAESHGLATGTNYAYGGASTGSGTYSILNLPNTGTQIGNYLIEDAVTPTGDELFVLWGGGNDLLSGQTDATVPADNLAAHITTLANAGATTFLVPNLLPLGQTPRHHGTTDEATFDALTASFNTALAGELATLRTTLNITIFELDLAGLYADIVADPAAFGLTNLTDDALGDQGNPGFDADAYLFRDDIHPTTRGHELIADAAFTLVPEPTTVLLLAAPLTLALTRRPRRRPLTTP